MNVFTFKLHSNPLYVAAYFDHHFSLVVSCKHCLNMQIGKHCFVHVKAYLAT